MGTSWKMRMRRQMNLLILQFSVIFYKWGRHFATCLFREAAAEDWSNVSTSEDNYPKRNVFISSVAVAVLLLLLPLELMRRRMRKNFHFQSKWGNFKIGIHTVTSCYRDIEGNRKMLKKKLKLSETVSSKTILWQNYRDGPVNVSPPASPLITEWNWRRPRSHSQLAKKEEESWMVIPDTSNDSL